VRGIPGKRPLNRIGVCAGLIVVLALPASALAATSTSRYRGLVAGGGVVRLKAVVSDGAIVQVDGLRWRRLGIRCQQGEFHLRGGFAGESFPVSDARFRATGAAGGSFVSHARMVGSFRKHGKRVAGTLRVRGDLDAHHTNCRSGTQRWWARRTG
jgi:hypothetical protein